MSIPNYVFLGIAVALTICYSTYVSYHLLKTYPVSDVKRRIQLCMIWLIPLIGAWVVNQVLKIDHEPIVPYNPTKQYTPPDRGQ